MNIELKLVLKNMLAHPWFDAEKVDGNEKIEKTMPLLVYLSLY